MERAGFGIQASLDLSSAVFQRYFTVELCFVPNSGLRKFDHGTSTIFECVLLTTLGDDGGSSQVLLAVDDDRHLLNTLSIQLCVQHDE